jgi:hypothetical protein
MTQLTWRRLPHNIPTDAHALVAQYQPLVRRLVGRRVKYGIAHVDAEAEVWCRLLRANVLDKFILNRLVGNPTPCDSDFVRYFYVAANNHLKNVFRTLERKYNRERLCDEDVLERGKFNRQSIKATLTHR